MLIEPGVIDANILVYSINPEAPQHEACRDLLKTARNPAVSLYVTSQILCEFYAVVTNKRRVTVPTSPADAVMIVSDLLAQPGIRVLPAPEQAVAKLLALLQRRAVVGSHVFDLQIVATMLANYIQRIYTFNVIDFQRFPELSVIAPAGDIEHDIEHGPVLFH